MYKNNLTEENYDSSKEPFQIILTHFDTLKGPKIFLASPPEVPDYIDTLVCNLLDLNLPEGFFEHRIMEKGITLGNYIFEIDSEWARGNVESLMLTVVLRSQQKFDTVKEHISQIAHNFQTVPELYKGFYLKDDKTDPEIREKNYHLTYSIASSQRFLERYLASIQMGKILIVGNKSAGKTQLVQAISDNNSNFRENRFSGLTNFNENAIIEEKTPGILMLNHFLEQVEFWLYDLDTFPCTMWFDVCQNPISIIVVFDPTMSKHEMTQLHKNLEKIVTHYCYNDIEQSTPKKIPILLLVNGNIEQSNCSEEEVYELMQFQQFPVESSLNYVSIENNYGIQESLCWISIQLLDLAPNSWNLTEKNIN